MLRKEALTLIGRRVMAHTSANGVYTGVLEAVTDDRPFRAKVRIDGVLEPACCWELRQFRPRTGYRVGQLIEVGHNFFNMTDAVGFADYYEAMLHEAAAFQKTFDDYRAGKHGDPNDRRVQADHHWHGRAAEKIRRSVDVLRIADRVRALRETIGDAAFREAARSLVRDGVLGPQRVAYADRDSAGTMFLAVFGSIGERHVRQGGEPAAEWEDEGVTGDSFLDMLERLAAAIETAARSVGA